MHEHIYKTVLTHPVTNLLSILCVLVKICSDADVKKKTKRLKDVKVCTFIGHSSSDMAMKGLN